jgi:methionine-rich copper-binding protein CopC
MKNKLFLLALSMIGLAFTGHVSAHAMLEKSSPANEAVLSDAPKVLNLEFGHPTKLAKLKLINVDQTSKEIPVVINTSAPASKTYAVALPALKAGKYQAKWGTMSKDGHVMTGALSFTIKGH